MIKKIKNVWIRVKQNIDIRTKNTNRNHITKTNDIVILNTAIGTNNLGDEIIMYYYSKALADVLDVNKMYNVATHNYPSESDIKTILKAKYALIIGTNILSPQMELYSGWKFDNRLIKLRNVVLVGVGWWGYKKPSLFSKYVYENILSKDVVHSVRDEQTVEMLEKCGVKNVVKTNCLTMLGLDEKCSDIPKNKSERVIFTITSVMNNIDKDKNLIRIIKQNYNDIYFWPQGENDLEYLKTLDNISDINILDASLEDYTNFLETTDSLDYIGTRLHGGIHALQNGKRAIIIAVDNRAVEISKDTGLIVITDDELNDKLEVLINTEWETKISLNKEGIEEWHNNIKRLIN